MSNGTAQEIKRYCALYARVSTDGQDLDNQLLQLRAYALQRGWKITDEYTDTDSGATAKRTGLASLIEESTTRDFDTVLVWSLDRLSRQGLFSTCRLVADLRDNGVNLISLQEPWFETSGPLGEVLIAFAAWVAAQERERISSRVKAGLERAAKKGNKPGRPKRPIDPALIEAMNAGTPISQLDTKMSRASLYRLRQEQTGSGGRQRYRAVFSQPKGALNPMGLTITDEFTVELFQHRARWNARLVNGDNTAFQRLPVQNRATLEQIKAQVAELFEHPLTDWQGHRTTTAPAQPTPTSSGENREP
jgi:DNA invertase Pin-like site-specific DNA recombinase